MIRWIVRFIVLTSLLLGVAAGAVWVRSYREAQTVLFGRGRYGTTQASFLRGRAMLTWCESPHARELRPPAVQFVAYRPDTWDLYQQGVRQSAVRQWRRMGVGWTAGAFPASGVAATLKYWQVDVPLWPIVAAAAVAPVAYAVVLLRRRRRRQAGGCLNCGYDLRSGHERCPECGHPVPTEPVEPRPPPPRRRALLRVAVLAATGIALAGGATFYVLRPVRTGSRAAWFNGWWDVEMQPSPSAKQAAPQATDFSDMRLRVLLRTYEGKRPPNAPPGPYVAVLRLSAYGQPNSEPVEMTPPSSDAPGDYGFSVDGDLISDGGPGGVRFWRDGADIVLDLGDVLTRARPVPAPSTTQPSPPTR